MSYIQPAVAATEKILARFPWLVRLYAAPYKRIVARELAEAAINETDTLLQIGCGAIPFTAIHLAALSRAHIIAIDNDAAAVTQARQLITALGLNSRIEIRQAEGTEVACGNCNAVFVALQARPKAAILAHLLNTCPPGARFIFRAPTQRFSSQYDPVPTAVLTSRWVHQPMPTFKRSFIYEA